MTLSQVPGGSILFDLRWGYGLPIVSAHKTNAMIKHTRIINTIDQLKDKTKSGFNYRIAVQAQPCFTSAQQTSIAN